MSYTCATMLLVGVAFALALIAIILIVHCSYRRIGGEAPRAETVLPECYQELLTSRRVHRLFRRARFDFLFRNRLFRHRERVLRRWRLSRKERSMLMNMRDEELIELYNAFHSR